MATGQAEEEEHREWQVYGRQPTAGYGRHSSGKGKEPLEIGISKE